MPPILLVVWFILMGSIAKVKAKVIDTKKVGPDLDSNRYLRMTSTASALNKERQAQSVMPTASEVSSVSIELEQMIAVAAEKA